MTREQLYTDYCQAQIEAGLVPSDWNTWLEHEEENVRTTRYQLWLYDVWGNARDGWDINEWRPALRATYKLPDGSWSIMDCENVFINIADIDNTPDSKINRLLRTPGVQWDFTSGDDINGFIKRNGKPYGFLRPVTLPSDNDLPPTKTIVLIDDDSVGEVIEAPNGIAVGEIVKIKLHNENGHEMTKLGYITEILED